MSANNLLYIKEKLGGTFKYYLSMRDADTGSVLEYYGRFPTLRKAAERASEIMEEEIVEYGLRIDLKPEKWK